MATQDSANMAKDNRQFGLDLIHRIEAKTGIKIEDLFSGDNDAEKIRESMHERIVDYVQKKLDKEEPSEAWPGAGQQKDARSALGLSDDINVVPNVSVLQYNYPIIKGYEGQELNDFVRRVSNGLALIQDGQSPGQVAGEIIGSGLSAFALAMIIGTVKALRAGSPFRAALTSGVRAMGGVSVVVGVALLIITELLLYLLVNNKKQFLGMLFNNTDADLVVDNWRNGTGGSDNGDLFVSTGKVSSFPEQHQNEKFDSPLIQVGARQILDPDNPNSPDNMILGGIYYGEKNIGLYGTEGAMVLHPYGSTYPRFGLLFACPYTMDNGVNVSIDTTTRSAKDTFNALYSSRDLYKSVTSDGYTFSARTAWKTGGETMGLATLDKL